MRKKGDLSTSTPSVKRQTKKILATPPTPDASMRKSGPVEVLSRSSNSPLTEIYESEEFKTEWANSIQFHVALNLLHLRKFRDESQSAVGRAMGTSQSAIARIETGQENVTLDTLQRLIGALRGRFYVSIYPQECPFPRPLPWWEWIGSPSMQYVEILDSLSGKAGAVYFLAGTSETSVALLAAGSTYNATTQST